ncbi:MAG: hypothetical protein PHS34_08750, partial [Candidatus Omnitrophica bacterium]|nr:hypothetical protein [Candidatus Omnitrophota bacterium]
MASQAKGKVVVFSALALGVLGLAMATPAFATEAWINREEKKKGKAAVGKTLKQAAKNFSKELVASAKKWAAKRGIPAL